MKIYIIQHATIGNYQQDVNWMAEECDRNISLQAKCTVQTQCIMSFFHRNGTKMSPDF